MRHHPGSKLITDTTPAEFFQASVGAAMEDRSVRADDDTVLEGLKVHFLRLRGRDGGETARGIPGRLAL